MGNEPSVGMEWAERDQALNFMKEWHLREGPKFVHDRSSDKMLVLKYVNTGKDCDWSYRFAKGVLTDYMWRLKRISEKHTCRRGRQSSFHRNLDTELITYCIKEEVEYDPSIPIPILMESIRAKYGYDVHYHTV